MSDGLTEQVARQCDAVARLATALAKVSSDYAELFRSGLLPELTDQVGQRTAAHMEILGDILNGMDACDQSDQALDDTFKEAHRLWPDSLNKEGWSA